MAGADDDDIKVIRDRAITAASRSSRFEHRTVTSAGDSRSEPPDLLADRPSAVATLIATLSLPDRDPFDSLRCDSHG